MSLPDLDLSNSRLKNQKQDSIATHNRRRIDSSDESENKEPDVSEVLDDALQIIRK